MNLPDRLTLVNERNLNVLGVDIGKEGGYCFNYFANRDNSDRLILELHDNPANPLLQWEIIQRAQPDIIVAEDVHAWNGQGVVSVGTLMEAKGRLIGMAAALNIHVKFIEPLAWIECYTIKRTKHFKDKKKWKEHLLEIAERELSEVSYAGLNLKTADAFLIWNYEVSQHTPQPLKKIGLSL